MEDPTSPTPPASAVPPPVVGYEPVNAFAKAIKDAAEQLKEQVDRRDVRDFIVRGIFNFLSDEFPPAAPLLGIIEPVVQHAAEIGAK